MPKRSCTRTCATLCARRRAPKGPFDLFAVEGGTAAICYVLRSLRANGLLARGDRIALGTPIFTPYLELPLLEDYGLEVVHVRGQESRSFQWSAEDLAPLLDPAVKVFVVVNPGNPSAVALAPETIGSIAAVVAQRPDLILLTDDVYATFVDGFRSLLAELPRNTIGLYSYSKYFGCTGWRLGVIALHRDNVVDETIARHSPAVAQRLERRYASLSLEPRKLRFIDRMVADSRDVALNHTAGLSGPQQAMMTLLSIAELMDESATYRRACTALLERRVNALRAGMGVQIAGGALFDRYYGLIDFERWIAAEYGSELVRWMKANVHPLDIVFRLAEEHGIVLLNGGGFDAPDWSARVSFANLDDAVYDDIGRAMRALAQEYWRAYCARNRRAMISEQRGARKR